MMGEGMSRTLLAGKFVLNVGLDASNVEPEGRLESPDPTVDFDASNVELDGRLDSSDLIVGLDLWRVILNSTAG